MWSNLYEGILSEFVEAARFTNEDTYTAFAELSERRKEQHRKDCAAYRGRKRLDPAWRAKHAARVLAARRAK